MTKILVPLDGSALAEQVLPNVRVLAPLMSAEIHLLHVVTEADRYHLLFDDPRSGGELEAAISARAELGDVQHGGVATTPAETQISWEVLRLNAVNYLAEQAEKLRADGIATSYSVELGNPAEVIAETAVHIGARLIAMATHGYSGLRRWALGSVADKVLHITETPMLLMRASDRMLSPERAIKKIMLPLDGSQCARQAIPFAVDLASQTKAELLLLTVVTPPYLQMPEVMGSYLPFDEAVETIRQRLGNELGAYEQVLDQHKVSMTPLAVSGLPAEAIVDEAIDRNADLVVMATHGASGLRRWALGSVADKVLHSIPVPLLLVRAQP